MTPSILTGFTVAGCALSAVLCGCTSDHAPAANPPPATAAPGSPTTERAGSPAPCPVQDLIAAWRGRQQNCLEPEVLSHLFYPGTAISRARADQYSQQVAFIQLRLRDLGYHVIIDGKFGPQTEAAVRHYQTDNGFTVDGIVGLQTWEGLFGLGPT